MSQHNPVSDNTTWSKNPHVGKTEGWGLYKQVSSLGGYFMRVINHFYVPHSTLYLSNILWFPQKYDN